MMVGELITKLSSDEEKNIEEISLNYKIMTDEPAENPADFRKYSVMLSNIIINSKPQFTVGIYGGWGTGKTTLMRMMVSELQRPEHEDDTLVIWFDAWWYKNEKYMAIIPLIRTIKIAIDSKIFHDKKNTGRADLV